ncbi:hydrogenase maturation protease [Halorientalis regularis]|jgi:hydrogenase maturation protease|uniref:Hydrogenase maturation protease n=1 Tax=Halorientalis regularis TaxID=660518 RepID=A0A1G7MR74_9EURY|nr:hydrogenase maturation protease [Halorientalis regularis]SDF64161.1 hydrogenase maturation protease [Halorientalis regularis]
MATDRLPCRSAAATAVVGVGNPTRRDDGVGRAVVRRLELPAVETAFAGTTAMFALEALSGHERGVVVDAVADDAPAGTVGRYRLDAPPDGTPEVTLHDFTIADALRSCRSVYDLPERLVLVGIVPAAVEVGVGVTDPVAAAVPTAAALVRAECGLAPQHDGGQTMQSTWYCEDCQERIDAEALDDHEARGHRVRGRMRPERLLAQDPWETGEGGDG